MSKVENVSVIIDHLNNLIARGELSPSDLNPFSQSPSARNKIVARIEHFLNKELQTMGITTHQDVVKLVDSVVGFGILQPLIVDRDITNINVLSYDKIYYEKWGKWHQYHLLFDDPDDYQIFILGTAAKASIITKKPISTENPVIEVPLGSRMGRMQIDTTSTPPSLFVRKGREQPISLSQMFAYGGMPEDLINFLSEVAARPVGILIAGLPGTGKTTLLEALTEYFCDGMVIAIDDNSEFKLRSPFGQVYNVPSHKISQALESGLRKNASRCVVSEIRGNEAATVLTFANTYTMAATIHGDINSSITRLMALAKGAPNSPYKDIDANILLSIVNHAFPVRIETGRIITDNNIFYYVKSVMADNIKLVEASYDGVKISYSVDSEKLIDFFNRHPRTNYASRSLDYRLYDIFKYRDKKFMTPQVVYEILCTYIIMHAGIPEEEKEIFTSIMSDKEMAAYVSDVLREIREAYERARNSNNWKECMRIILKIKNDPILRRTGMAQKILNEYNKVSVLLQKQNDLERMLDVLRNSIGVMTNKVEVADVWLRLNRVLDDEISEPYKQEIAELLAVCNSKLH